MKRINSYPGSYNPLVIYISLLAICFCFIGEVKAQSRADMAVMARDNLYEHWDFKKAAYYFDQIIGKRHTPAFAYSDYGWYLMILDQFEEGLSYVEKAAKMDPKDKQLASWYASGLLWKGDLAKAEQWAKKSLSIDPNYGEAYYTYSLIASEQGRHQRALELAELAASNDVNWRGAVPLVLANAGKIQEAIKEAEKIAADINTFDTMLLMEAYAVLGEEDKALEYMKMAYNMRHPFMPWIEMYPSVNNLLDDPRFKAIVKKVNLPE